MAGLACFGYKTLEGAGSIRFQADEWRSRQDNNKKALKRDVFKAFCFIFCGDGAHGGI